MVHFNKQFDPRYGELVDIAPGIRRLTANNGGPFTFTGTNTYVVGSGRVAVIDPGPDDPAHLAKLLAGLGGESISHIIVTHTHLDHCGGVAHLRRFTDAPVVAEGPHRPARPMEQDEINPLDASSDMTFEPDISVDDGTVIQGGDWRLTALLTPGHTVNHAAFVLDNGDAVFCGDHVMAWSTSIVAPPDGSMGDYMASLDKLTGYDAAVFHSGHGAPIADPATHVAGLKQHRIDRETALLDCLTHGPQTIMEIVDAVYHDIPDQLKGAAGLSVQAQLEYLESRQLIRSQSSDLRRYRLAGG